MKRALFRHFANHHPQEQVNFEYCKPFPVVVLVGLWFATEALNSPCTVLLLPEALKEGD
jgi:hypothetical protein